MSAHVQFSIVLRKDMYNLSYCTLHQVLRFLEVFSGTGNVSLCLRLSGYFGASLDIAYHQGMDINTDVGMGSHAINSYAVWLLKLLTLGLSLFLVMVVAAVSY